jgi:hypothetical protein
MTAYLKAIVAALIAGLAVLLSAVQAADPLVAEDWIRSAIAFLVALSAVWAVPNKQPTEEAAP